MSIRITELAFHPVVVAWMVKRFGESCSATTVLLMLAVFRLAKNPRQEWNLPHAELVLTIAGISAESSRPQRVPTFREFIELFEEYWSTDAVRELHYDGVNAVDARQAREIVNAIASYEMTVASARIGGHTAA